LQTISVAICTWNRERLLAGTLESLCRVRPLEKLTFEVVVILNNCTDHSRDVVDQFRTRLPIVCETEPRSGLSHARNKAIDVASGDVIIWIDDDVRVEPDWLRAYESAFLQWPQASIFGGAILPEFEGQTPAWLSEAWHLCDSAFAARRLPEANAPILPEDNYPPYGANFAVRTAAQRRFRYDGRLGARPGGLVMTGEETELIRAIFADGGAGRWVRSAVVRHVMPPERQTVRSIRAYYEGCGYLAERRSHRTDFKPSFINRLRDSCTVIASDARFRWLRAFAHPTRWVPSLVAAATARGTWIARYRTTDEERTG
jgi:glycosyltransferase involved in cell wall biosynthesis